MKEFKKYFNNNLNEGIGGTSTEAIIGIIKKLKSGGVAAKWIGLGIAKNLKEQSTDNEVGDYYKEIIKYLKEGLN